jgi:hypothetical protein
MQECGEADQQTAVVAADVKDALDRPANLRLYMLKQTRPENLISVLEGSIIFESR